MSRASSCTPTRLHRVAVPLDVRRGLTRLGRVQALSLLGISPSNYEECIAPNGMILEKTLTKLRDLLAKRDSSS